jgi:hypothetical protein
MSMSELGVFVGRWNVGQVSQIVGSGHNSLEDNKNRPRYDSVHV